MISIKSSFLIFGGWTSIETYASIARFDTTSETWSEVGTLNSGRNGHGVLRMGDDYLVIGGRGVQPTERCSVSNDFEVTCASMEPFLSEYDTYPGLFYVSKDYCRSTT